jgi:prevent-host-death family protein
MKTVNIQAAKTDLPRLVDRVAEGEEIIIARHGKPVARLSALAPRRTRRRPGLMRGRIAISKDFDAPLPRHVLEAFYRAPIEPPRGRQ